MMHPHMELRFISEEMGHGVFATRAIPRGTVVWILCRFDRVYTPQEIAALPEAYQRIVGRYGYIDGRGQYVLCWDHGRYINHSCDPATLGVGPELEIAVRDIAAGEQITCEYGGLNITAELRCDCGSPRCRGRVRAQDVLQLAPTWDAQIAAAIVPAAQVEQPLLPYMQHPGLFQAWAAGTTPLPSHREYFAGRVASSAGGSPQQLWAPAAVS